MSRSWPDGVLEPVVDHHVRELAARVELLVGRGAAARRSASGSSVPRPTSRVRSASSLGGAMKIWIASGIASRIWRAPWTSISSTTGRRPPIRASSSERSVP